MSPVPMLCTFLSFVAVFVLYTPAVLHAQESDQNDVAPPPAAEEADSEDLKFLTGEGNAPPLEARQLARDIEPLEIPSENVLPKLPAKEEESPNIFFDADVLVPTGEMGSKGGPRKVNPILQPASKLVVVNKNHEADSAQAGLVSAERALKLGRYGAALEMYNDLYKKNKNDPNVIMGRATALQHLDRNEEAVISYEALLEIHPENIEAQVNMLGLIGQRYPAVALQRLNELKQKNPQNAGIVAQIALAHAALGQFDEALQYLGMAASIEPTSASHVYNSAIIADKAGNRDEAVKYYEQALEVDTIYGGNRSIPREAVFERLAQIR